MAKIKLTSQDLINLTLWRIKELKKIISVLNVENKVIKRKIADLTKKGGQA